MSANFRFPGVLNSQEMLVAEAIHARAWETICRECLQGDEAEAKARLGGIVVRLISDRSQSIGDLTSSVVRAFRDAAG